MNSCDALVAISDHILNSINSLNKFEYNKNGRKYKFINNGFQRIKQEDKHLIVNVNDLLMKCSIISSYTILHNINDGKLIENHPDFCLAIIGMARELEVNQWFENSNVIHYNSLIDLSQDMIKASINFSQKIQPKHLKMGLDLLVASKLNFFHTDHHLGTKIFGVYLIKFMKEYFGEDSINESDILVALKSFVHWGSIKCILYKLEVPNVLITDDEFLLYKNFPSPAPELKQEIYKKYPSGTSRYLLLKTALLQLLEFEYSSLIKYPDSDKFDLDWLFALCRDIESDPIKYHLRSSLKSLAENPINLNELSQKYAQQTKDLMSLVAMLVHIFDLNLEVLLKNSKLPKFEDIDEPELILMYSDLSNKISFYRLKDWSKDDILLRLATQGLSLKEKVDSYLL